MTLGNFMVCIILIIATALLGAILMDIREELQSINSLLCSQIAGCM